MEDYLNVFKKFTSNYVELTNTDFDLLKNYVSYNKIKKKEHLLIEGEKNNKLYFILRGILRIYRNIDGTDVTLTFIKEHDFYIDFPSVLNNLPSELNVECLEEVEYLELPYNKLEEAYTKSINISNIGRLMVERAFMSYMKLLATKQTSPALSYEAFEAENKDIINRIPLKVLASFIGVTPESLSRIRKRRLKA